MRLISSFILSIMVFFFINTCFALDSDENLEYLEKNKKQALDIVKYKQEKEAKDLENKLIEEQKNKLKDLQKYKEDQERLLIEKIKQDLLAKELKNKQIELDKKLAALERERREKEAREKAERDRLNRINRPNTIKIVRLSDRDKSYLETEEFIRIEKRNSPKVDKIKLTKLSDKDNIELDLNKNKYYVSNYADIGFEEIYASSAVNRNDILTNDIYVSLLIQTSVSSRRAASFIGLVERNVYSPDSYQILIPKGSKFICDFETLTVGETSIKAQCDEVILPDGRKIKIDSVPVYDQMGRAGIVGVLDNKLWEKYGQAFLSSALGAAGMVLAGKTPSANDGTNFFNYTALNVMDLSKTILKTTINLAPVVTVSSGTRVLVRLTQAINFEIQENDDEI